MIVTVYKSHPFHKTKTLYYCLLYSLWQVYINDLYTTTGPHQCCRSLTLFIVLPSTSIHNFYDILCLVRDKPVPSVFSITRTPIKTQWSCCDSRRGTKQAMFLNLKSASTQPFEYVWKYISAPAAEQPPFCLLKTQVPRQSRPGMTPKHEGQLCSNPPHPRSPIPSLRPPRCVQQSGL